MPRYRFTTLPTGARKGEWRETQRQAMEDAVAAGCGEFDDNAPSGVNLDPTVVLEQESAGLSDRELWACAAETLRQYGAGAPAFVADRIGALALDGDMAGVAAWKVIAARSDQLSSGSANPS